MKLKKKLPNPQLHFLEVKWKSRNNLKQYIFLTPIVSQNQNNIYKDKEKTLTISNFFLCPLKLFIFLKNYPKNDVLYFPKIYPKSFENSLSITILIVVPLSFK